MSGSHAHPPFGSVTQLLMSTLDRLAHGGHPHSEEEVMAEAAAGDMAVEDGPAEETSTLGALLDAMDERAYGLLLLILALPCCLPFLYGIPQIVALPMIAITAQLALGREAPWLPKPLRERRFEIAGMRNVVTRAAKYLGWVERLARPRLSFLTDNQGARVVGLLLLIPCASILVPLPSTNTIPGLGVAIASVGLLERDGALTLLGLLIGLGWVALLIFVVVFFGTEAIHTLKDVLMGRGGEAV